MSGEGAHKKGVLPGLASGNSLIAASSLRPNYSLSNIRSLGLSYLRSDGFLRSFYVHSNFHTVILRRHLLRAHSSRTTPTSYPLDSVVFHPHS